MGVICFPPHTAKLEARLQLAQCKYLHKLTEGENSSWAHAGVSMPVESLEELFPWRKDRSVDSQLL